MALIGALIANGQLIEGYGASPSVPSSPTGGTQSSIEGFIDLAFFGFAIPQVWLASGTAAFVLDSGYPCNPLQGTTKCSGYTYIDETSSASPKVSDCNQIIKNIQGTSGTWTTGIGGQRSLASFGTCHFGVQNKGVTGDVTYFTGTQDIVNIITQAISQFAFNGLVGAKGYMNCGGDVNSQKAEWGLY